MAAASTSNVFFHDQSLQLRLLTVLMMLVLPQHCSYCRNLLVLTLVLMVLMLLLLLLLMLMLMMMMLMLMLFFFEIVTGAESESARRV